MVVKSKVKYIQSLSQKKHRESEKVFIAEGPKIINELLNEPQIQPVELFALKNWLNGNSNYAHLAVTEVDEVLLSRLSNLSTPNQVIGIFRMPEHENFNPEKRISILLDNIQDPGNLGTIVRCADWFGVEQVVCSKDCADIYNSKTIQSSMGSIARVKVFYNDLTDIIIKHTSIPVYAAALEGTSINDMSPLKEGLILIGNESKGISDELLKLAREKITIPRRGSAESLNAAIATGIILSRLVG